MSPPTRKTQDSDADRKGVETAGGEAPSDSGRDATEGAREAAAQPRRRRSKPVEAAAPAAAGAAGPAAKKPRRRRRRAAGPAGGAAESGSPATVEDADTTADAPSAPQPASADVPAPAQSPGRSRRRDAAGPVTVSAQARYVRTSARKARLVCDHLRGQSVERARAILATAPRAVAEDWSKLLESAVASAEHNHELLGDELAVAAVHADEGPTLKRFRPRAMGRATRIRKRTSHLSITLTSKD